MYRVENYWDEVALKIAGKTDTKLIAGDDEPYYRYKRKEFLKLFDELEVKGKNILEIGSGPGGNLQYLYHKGCRTLTGVDISERMIEIAREQLKGKEITIQKTNGIELPFSSSSFDLVFTSTVLQHNTVEANLLRLIHNMCHVSKKEIVLFERIEKSIKGHDSNLGRPVFYYEDLFSRNGFQLERVKFMPIQCSYFVCGVIRKLFNSKDRKEGEKLSRISVFLEKITLPVTKLVDKMIPSRRDVAMLHFVKEN